MDKEAFYSLIVTDMSRYANHFDFGYYKRLEVLSLLFTVNGPDRIHTVLTRWMTTNYCPKGLLPCAFMSACCDMFGSTASQGSFARYQFSSALGTTIDDWILSLLTIAHVCEHANKGQMKYNTAAALTKRTIMGAGPMGINHFVGCAVIMGVLLPTSFSGNALLSESCSDKIALIISQGSRTARSKTLCAFQTAMRQLRLHDSYGDQVFCESSRKCEADDVFHPSQNIYRVNREKDDELVVLNSGGEKCFTPMIRRNQIKMWLSIKERETYFPWWELPIASRYDIQSWSKKICHEESLVHTNMVHFAHTKHNRDEVKLQEEEK
eukprot:scaffold32449_cov55-Attheya_sp.AAC.2